MSYSKVLLQLNTIRSQKVQLSGLPLHYLLQDSTNRAICTDKKISIEKQQMSEQYGLSIRSCIRLGSLYSLSLIFFGLALGLGAGHLRTACTLLFLWLWCPFDFLGFTFCFLFFQQQCCHSICSFLSLVHGRCCGSSHVPQPPPCSTWLPCLHHLWHFSGLPVSKADGSTCHYLVDSRSLT